MALIPVSALAQLISQLNDIIKKYTPADDSNKATTDTSATRVSTARRTHKIALATQRKLVETLSPDHPDYEELFSFVAQPDTPAPDCFYNALELLVGRLGEKPITDPTPVPSPNSTHLAKKRPREDTALENKPAHKGFYPPGYSGFQNVTLFRDVEAWRGYEMHVGTALVNLVERVATHTPLYITLLRLATMTIVIGEQFRKQLVQIILIELYNMKRVANPLIKQLAWLNADMETREDIVYEAEKCGITSRSR